MTPLQRMLASRHLFATHQSRAALDHPIEERLPLVSCPVLVVRGTRAPVAPATWSRQVAELLPDGWLREVPGAGHSMVYSSALELARVTDAFLVRDAV